MLEFFLIYTDNQTISDINALFIGYFTPKCLSICSHKPFYIYIFALIKYHNHFRQRPTVSTRTCNKIKYFCFQTAVTSASLHLVVADDVTTTVKWLLISGTLLRDLFVRACLRKLVPPVYLHKCASNMNVA